VSKLSEIGQQFAYIRRLVLCCTVFVGNVPPGHANMATQHVINMPPNMTPMFVPHHPGNVHHHVLLTHCSF